MRNYNSTPHLKSISAAVIAVAGLCLIPALASAQVAGPNPGVSVLTGPGVAGVANPTSLSMFERPGVAGNVPARTGSSSTLGPAIAPASLAGAPTIQPPQCATPGESQMYVYHYLDYCRYYIDVHTLDGCENLLSESAPILLGCSQHCSPDCWAGRVLLPTAAAFI